MITCEATTFIVTFKTSLPCNHDFVILHSLISYFYMCEAIMFLVVRVITMYAAITQLFLSYPTYLLF
jgi:hypothetical protein